MKKSVTLLILVLVLAGAIGGYIALSRYNAKQEAAESEASAETVAASVATADVTAIHWVTEEADAALALNKDGVWYYEADAGLPLNKAVPEGMLNTAACVAASRVIAEKPADAAQYGLEPARCTVTFTMKNGTETTFKFGNEAPSGELYFSTTLSPAVYLVSSDLLATYSKTTADLVTVEKIPTMNTVNAVEIKSKDGTVTITAEPKKSEDAENAYSVTVDGQKQMLTEENAAALDSEIAGLSFVKCIAYKGNSKDFGLDAPTCEITVRYTADNKENSFTLLLGKQDEESASYYAALKGSDCVYTIYTSNVDTLTTADPKALTTETN